MIAGVDKAGDAKVALEDWRDVTRAGLDAAMGDKTGLPSLKSLGKDNLEAPLPILTMLGAVSLESDLRLDPECIVDLVP